MNNNACAQPWKEIVTTPSGHVHQAGAPEYTDGGFVKTVRSLAEKNLYFFSRAIAGRYYLTEKLHLPICNFLQKRPPFYKLLLMPRLHAKTSLVSHCLPPHILIQPKETNVYFPGLDGSECRILLTGETEPMAVKNHRVVQAIFEENKAFRGLWPHRTYQNPKREAKKWNENESIIPRDTPFPDPSIRAIGVGGAITGSRPNVEIKDDLVSIEARNSEITMQRAIEWHVASRALLDEYSTESGLHSLEFIAGTRWAVWDLYQYIMDNDPTVEVNSEFKAIVQGGCTIWPEKFSLHTIRNDKGEVLKEGVDDLRKHYGSLFPLLYMNDANDPSLVDFDMELVRYYTLAEGNFVFPDDTRDTLLDKEAEIITNKGLTEGAVMSTKEVQEQFIGRDHYLRLKYA